MHPTPHPNHRPFSLRKPNAAGPGPIPTALAVGLASVLLLTMAGCVGGNPGFQESPAGFWAGLWHGLILLFTFVISLFSESVRVYEVANTGALYDLGFVLGVCIFFGGGGSKKLRPKSQRAKHREWREFSQKVEEKVGQGIATFLEETGKKDPEWEEIGQKIEEKIKRELRKWAEK